MSTPYDPSTLVRDYELPPLKRWLVIDDRGYVEYYNVYGTRHAAIYAMGDRAKHGYVVRKVLMFVKAKWRGRRTRRPKT